MKLTEQEKLRLAEASARHPRQETVRPPKPPQLTPAEYALRVEQFGHLFPRRKKAVSFAGNHWLL